MDIETIKKFDQLRSGLYDVEKWLNWMAGWEKTLYSEDRFDDIPEGFDLTIRRNGHHVVLQRDISREDVEAEFIAEKRRLEAKRDELKRQIEAL